MNKKLNTVLFILAGTVVNVVLAVFCIGILLLVVRLAAPLLNNEIAALVPFAFIGGIVFAMIIYQRLTKWVIVKFDMTEKLDPLFSSKRSNRKLRD